MIYVIKFLEYYDRSWLPIKTRATTDEATMVKAVNEWTNKGKLYHVEVTEVEEL